MQNITKIAFSAALLLRFSGVAQAVWPGFRGPGGLGTSSELGLPLTWSATKNVVWKTKLPGPGTS